MTPDAWNPQESGPAEAPPLLLLHGFLGAGADEWNGIIHGRGLPLRCITLDLPGHGHHRMHRDACTDFGALCDAIAALIEEKGWAPLRLLGYSLGGRVALHLALKHPQLVSHLVLESASPGLRSAEDRMQRRRADEALARQLESLQGRPDEFRTWLRAWYAQPLFAGLAAHPELLESTIALRARNDPAQLAAALRLLGTGMQPSLWEALPGLRMPALAVAGAMDEKFVSIAHGMAAACPRLRVEIIPGCSHNVHAEDPDRYTALIRAFLAAS